MHRIPNNLNRKVNRIIIYRFQLYEKQTLLSNLLTPFISLNNNISSANKIFALKRVLNIAETYPLYISKPRYKQIEKAWSIIFHSISIIHQCISLRNRVNSRELDIENTLSTKNLNYDNVMEIGSFYQMTSFDNVKEILSIDFDAEFNSPQ